MYALCSTLYSLPASANLSLISKRFHAALSKTTFSFNLGSLSLSLLETLNKSRRRQQLLKLCLFLFLPSAKQQRGNVNTLLGMSTENHDGNLFLKNVGKFPSWNSDAAHI